MGRLDIVTFGGLQVERDGEPLPPFSTEKVRALFAFLVTFRGRPHARSVLAGLLWPEVSEERARHNLSDALWRLRRVVGPEPLIADEDALEFNTRADYWLDVEEFEQQAARTPRGEREAARDSRQTSSGPDPLHLERAANLYRGEFLEGLYDDWALQERERLHLQYIGILEWLARWHAEQGELERALEYGLRLVAADPLREGAHRQVMAAYYRLGQPHAALQQFETCRRMLRDELGTEPLRETARLAEEIRENRDAVMVRRAGDGLGLVALVGRRGERAALLARMEAARAGQGGMVLVEGEAGVGKSRLVAEAAASAEWRGFQVLRGKCRDEPYSAIVEALGHGLTPLRAGQLARLIEPPELAALARVLPGAAGWAKLAPLPPLDPQGEKARLHEALAGCIVALGKIAPHVLVIEDWQWMDAATLEVILALAGWLLTARVLVVGTARDDELRDRPEVWNRVLALDRDAGLEHVALGSLSGAETEVLVRLALHQHQDETHSRPESPRPVPEVAAEVYARTRGNPLFVLEWLKALAESGELRRTDRGGWELGGTGTGEREAPAVVQRVIAARLARLAAADLRLLEAAAVLAALGDTFDFPVWCDVAGRDERALLAGSDELLRRRLIVEGAASYQFAHDLIGQVAYDTMAPEARRHWHRRAGLALERQAPERAEAIAFHFERAGDEMRALDYHLRAARRARAVYATQSAAHHCERAIALGERLTASGAPDATARERAAEALALRAELYTVHGDYGPAEASYEAALKLLPDDDTRQRAEILHGLGWLRGNYLGRFDEGLALLARARPLYEAAGDLPRLVETIARLGHLTASAGRWAESLPIYKEAESLALKAGHPAGRAQALMGRGVAYMFMLRPSEAVAELEAAAALYAETGDPWREAKCLANVGQARLHLPDLPGAAAAFRRAWVINEEIGADGAQPFILTGQTYACAGAGDLAAARRAAEDGLAIVKRLGGDSAVETMLLINLGRVQHSAGDLQAARATLEAGWEAGRERYPGGALTCKLDLAELYRLLGELDRARALAQEVLASAGDEAQPGARAQVLLCLGEIALDEGQLAAAREQLGFAFRLARQAHDWFGLGNSYLAMARYWLAAGRPERALALARRTARQAQAGGALVLRLQALLIAGPARTRLGRPDLAIELLSEVVTQSEAHGLPILLWRAAAAQADAQPARARDLLEQAWQAVDRVARGIDDLALRRSFLAAPEIARIQAGLQDLRRREGTRRRVSLLRAGAPGRRIDVSWTVDAGLADAELEAREGRIALRRCRLARLLAEARAAGTAPTHDDLAQALGVSPRTIRADLAALRAR